MTTALDQGTSDRGYVLRTAETLWPGAHTTAVRGYRPRSAGEQWHVLPSLERARLVVPVDGRIAERMLARRAGETSSASRRVLERAVSGRLGRLAPTWRLLGAPSPDNRFETVLSEIAGSRVDVGVRLGVPKPRRRPLIQAFAGDRVASWTKVATDSPNQARLKHEGAALRHLAGRFAHLDVPRVLGDGRWLSMDYLVLEPLPSGSLEWRQWACPWGAMSEVATIAGTRLASVADADLWSRWEAGLDTLSESSERAEIAARSAQVLTRLGDRSVVLGAWHGDWTAWNMGYRGDRLEVWDWENYATGIPVGFDPIHYAVQPLVAARAGADQVREELVRLWPSIEAMGAARASLTTVWALYLIEIAHRYLRGMAEGGTSGLKARLRWLLDQIGSLPELADDDRGVLA